MFKYASLFLRYLIVSISAMRDINNLSILAVFFISVFFSNLLNFLTPEPNGVGKGVYGIGRVLRRRRRRRDDVCVWTL